jgi:hypothetical protein
VFLSDTLAGERIGLEPIDDRWYTIYFAEFPLGYSTVAPEPFIDYRKQQASTSLMQGTGTCPFPCTPSPKPGPEIVNYVLGLNCQRCARLDTGEEEQNPGGA